MSNNLDDPLNNKGTTNNTIDKKVDVYKQRLENSANINRQIHLKKIQKSLIRPTIIKFLFIYSLIALPLVFSIYFTIDLDEKQKESFITSLSISSGVGFILATAGSLFWASERFNNKVKDYDRNKG